MRIALQTEASTSSTPGTTPSKSSGGSFLDILSQGTQNAAPQAKAVGSQQQSDAHPSNHSSFADPSAQEPSTPTQSSASTTNSSDAATQTQANPAPPAMHETKSSDQVADAKSQKVAESDPQQTDPQQTSAQNATDFAALAQSALAALLADKAGASPASSTSQSSAPSSTTTTSSSKQAGTKDTPSKQAATTSTPSDTTALQQALIALPQVVPVQEPIPQQGNTSLQSTSSVAPAVATSPTSLTTDGTDAANSTAKQVQPDQAQSVLADAAAALAAPTPAPQDSATVSAPAGSQPTHDVSVATAPAAKTAASTAAHQAATTAAQLTQAAGQDTTQAADQNGQMQDGQKQGAQQKATQNQQAQRTLQASTFFAAAVPQTDNSNAPSSAKTVPFKISSTNAGPNANVPAAGTSSTTTAASAVSVAKNAAQDSSHSSSRDGQPGSDSSQSAQADNAQAATSAVRNDVSAQTFAVNAATAHSSTQPAASSSASDPAPSHATTARNVPADQASSLPASSAINTARVIQNMNETEMRVGMRSTEFGDISIRTMVTQQQMQTQISVDHSELVSALTAHIPAAQAKLGADYGLHASIEVSQGGAGFTNQQQHQSSQQDYKPYTPSVQFDAIAPQTENDRLVASRPVATAIIAEGSRLDIRA